MQEKIYKYRTGFWNPPNHPIQKLEIQKETPHCYIIDGSRQSKSSRDHLFHDSHEEAKQYLIENAEKKIKALQIKLDNYKKLKP